MKTIQRLNVEKILLRRANEARLASFMATDIAMQRDIGSEADHWLAMFKAWVVLRSVVRGPKSPYNGERRALVSHRR
jgi:hypothetical protein